MNTNTNVVVVGQQPTNFGAVALFFLIGTVCLIAQYFWCILAVAALVTVGLLAYRAMTLQARRERALAARADRQNRLFLAGDQRGIYGDDHEGPQ